jgi:lipid-A-disaccharide synthase
MKLVIITGEESGDVLGASLMDALKKSYLKPIELYGIGGKELEKHNIKNFYNISDINVMGLIEVVPKIFKIKKIISQTVKKILKIKPDLVITIDSPDFNLRIASNLKNENSNLKIIQYVAPSVWNWRPKRIEIVKRSIDHLLTILPFEKKIFDKESVPTTFVGHPITQIDLSKFEGIKLDEVDKSITKPIFLILPGSRASEVKRLLPIFIDTINNSSFIDKFDFILPTTETMQPIVKSIISSKSLNFNMIIFNDEEKKFKSFSLAEYALIASGTVGLELSYFNVIYVSAYKFNFITYHLLKLLVKSKFGNLINIILGKMVIPELIQRDCNPKNINLELEKIIKNNDYQNSIKDNVSRALEELSLSESSSVIAAQTVIKVLNNER